METWRRIFFKDKEEGDQENKDEVEFLLHFKYKLVDIQGVFFTGPP